MNDPSGPLDVLTLGETMVRFTPPGFERFGQSPTVEIHVGGSESNTAVGLARLGLRSAWVSRMTDNPLGRWIVAQIAAHSVDVSRVVWTDADRVGTYTMERGAPPRDSQVFYDRAGSAMSRMQPSDVQPQWFTAQQVRLFHVTGITAGLSECSRATVQTAIELAKASDIQVSFDLNYRSRLWSAQTAYATCAPFLSVADLIFMPLRDAVFVCGIDARLRPDEICLELHRRWPQAEIVLTRGCQGAVAIDRAGVFYEHSAFEALEVERLGGGDAFSAGYLSATLSTTDVQTALRWGCAAAAIKYTLPGDLPVFDRGQVAALVDGTNTGAVNR